MLLLVRHGETAANVDGVLLGRADPPLTARGVEQVRALAAALPPADLVVASPLGRAVDTARHLVPPGSARDVTVDERWIELDYGEFDGMAPTDVPAATWERWRADATYVPPGGESLVALTARVEEACGELAERARRDVVIVVSHVSPIKAAVGWAIGSPPDVAWRMFVEDASVSRVDITEAGPVLRWFNRVSSSI